MADVTRIARLLITRSRSGTRRYRALLALPGARGFFFSAAIARLGVAMTGLGLLWTVRGLTDSFALAGASTAVFALGEAVVGPQVARLLDRFGQSVVLPVVLVVHVGGIGAALLGSTRPTVALVIAGSALAGAAVPQPGALSAARWTHLVPERVRLRTAFSLEAIVNDVVFVSGPPIVTLVSGLSRPYFGTVLAATLVIIGSSALASQWRTAPPKQIRERRPARTKNPPLLTRGFASTFGVTLGLGFFFGAAPVIVTGFASEQGYGPAAGFILALTSVASLASGLVYGATKERWPPHTVQLAAAILLFAAIALSAVSPTLPVLVIGLVLAGATIAPINVSSAQIVETNVPRASLTQGFTWINTASAAGIAAAGAVSGLVLQSGSVRAALLACCALVLVAPLSALVGIRRSCSATAALQPRLAGWRRSPRVPERRRGPRR